MGKSPQHVTQRKQRSGVMPAKKHVPRSRFVKTMHKRRMPFNQSEAILEALPESIIACDREGKILRINAAALKLFEVPSEDRYRGTFYQQFLQHYTRCDERQQALASEQWLLDLVIDESATERPPEKILELLMPSGRTAYVNQRSASVLDVPEHEIERVYVFSDVTHCHQKALHLQRVHDAVVDLTKAIVQIPEPIAHALPEGPLLLSPPVLFIAQQLVDVIWQVLKCQYVSLAALDSQSGHLQYLVGSGFTPEQKQNRQLTRGLVLPSDFLDEMMLGRLSANQEVILPAHHVPIPSDWGDNHHLLIPLFFDRQLVGALVVARSGFDHEYTPEEIDFVKVVATQIVLVMEGIHSMCTQTEARTRELVQQEIQGLLNTFLILASHELRTPLTSIKGHVQLAQHRLAALKRPRTEQIKQAQQCLESAAQSTRLQERIINDLIDDARIQANQLELLLTPRDLSVLVRNAVARQQQSVPERTIVLDIRCPEQTIPIIADAERITQVLNRYLANALNATPAELPVTVQVTIEDAVARVSVHDEGPGIPLEEQKHLWERFYRAKGSAVQHELDLSLGLGLYLCRALIELHHGQVGVQSVLDHGTTFWFTLPIAVSPSE